jgi:heterodisulfide reductase subunit D
VREGDDMSELIQSLELCDECGACLEVCPTYKATKNNNFSPIGRIGAAGKILQGKEVTPEAIESIYSCPECHLCTGVCPYEIDVAEAVIQSRIELVNRGVAPLERQKAIIEGIQKLGNAVNGDPSKRLDWLPEGLPTHESSTLLYIGCLASYMVKDAAISSYRLLKKLGVDFMILPDEGCCGIYYHEVGKTDLAREKFRENTDRFRELGIKRIITTCGGCYHAFKRLYPRLLGDMDFEVLHIIQLLPSLLKERGVKTGQKEGEITYHDPCRLGRLGGFYDEPREAMELCGVKVNELPQNRENGLCCGAGGAVRSVYRDLSLKLASDILDQAPTDQLVTTCPFCQFNFSYTIRKTESDKKIAYIADTILKALS